MDSTFIKPFFNNGILIFYLSLLTLLTVFFVIRKLFYKPEYPYHSNPQFMTNNEKNFFMKLSRAIDGKYHILCQVNLSSLVKVNETSHEWRRYMNKINQKSIDFVLLSKQTLNPVILIELDDVTHLLSERKRRDSFIDHVTQRAGIPLIHIKSSGDYQNYEIEKIIENSINK